MLRQDIKAETETERLRQRLISQEGAQRRGDIRVAQAALGQLVDVGSAADITEDLAGEVAFKKLISQRESDLHKRNLTIEASSLETDRSLLGVQASADRRATRINQFGTALTTASTLSRRFRVSSGSLAFRT